MITKEDTIKVSVIIATLARDVTALQNTINQVNAGTTIPSEIIICVPKDEQADIEVLSRIDNVSIFRTNGRGQVFQRAEGFKAAKYEYVLQLDDDCTLSTNAIEVLVDIVSKREGKTAAAPVLIDAITNRSLHERKPSGTYEKFLALVLNGTKEIKPGTITKAGVNFGVDFKDRDDDTLETEWLSGGCMLHRKEDLVLENFYPFPGKAFCEDLIHSHFLKKKGVTLIITSRCYCKTSLDPIVNSSYRSIYKDTLREHIARKYFMKLGKRESKRAYIFFAMSLALKFCKVAIGRN